MIDTSKTLRQVRVWDLPTRIFHWLLAATFLMAWLSYDDSRHLDLHIFAGYLFLSLLLFRLIWGVFGTHYARFKEFSYNPQEVFSYIKGLFGNDLRRYVGHNPAGAWAIFSLIGLGFLLTLSGLLVLGGEEQQGPLAELISFQQSPPLRTLHEFSAWALLSLIFVHICGVISESLLHRENLVGAMFRGTKWVRGQSATVPAHRLIATSIVVATLSWAGIMFGGYLTNHPDRAYLPFKGPALATSQTWNVECSDCHLAFHPSLLPARSWQRLLDEQDQHFDEELMLDEDVVTELRSFANKNSAEQEATEAAWQINRKIKADESPIQITKTAYWLAKHKKITQTIWQQKEVLSKSNCSACHLDAKQGHFEDSAMQLPGQVRGLAVPSWARTLFFGQ